MPSASHWVAVAVAVVVTTVVLAALAFLVLDIAVSMVAFLLIIMPEFANVLMAWFSNREDVNVPFGPPGSESS